MNKTIARSDALPASKRRMIYFAIAFVVALVAFFGMSMASTQRGEAETLSPDEALSYEQTFEFSAPQNITFEEQDPVLYIYSVDEEVNLVYSGKGALQISSLPRGSYIYIAKAAHCDVISDLLEVEGSGTHAIAFPMQPAWNGSDADTFWYENHLEDTTLYIRTPADLAGLAELVDNDYTLEGYNIVQLSDLDMGLKNWNPIGDYENSAAKVFKGNYDGNGYIIVNVSISSSSAYTGLFSAVDGSTLCNMNVIGQANTSGNYASGLVGVARNATIDYCYVDLQAQMSGSVNGIICAQVIAGGPTCIINCISEGVLTIDTINESTHGGVVGEMQEGSIEDCINKASIVYSASSADVSRAAIGGIVGVASGTEVELYNNVNEGSIVSNRGQVGGIAGSLDGSHSITAGCINTGTITVTSIHSDSYRGVGGLAGTVGESGTVVGSYNSGKVLCDDTGASASAAGIADVIYKDVLIANCYNVGDIEVSSTASSWYASGIAGETVDTDSVIEGCYSAGTLTTTNATKAGILGVAGPNSPKLRSNYYLNSTALRGVGDASSDVDLQTAAKDPDYMKSIDQVVALNEIGPVYAVDDENTNNGFPIFAVSLYERITKINVEPIADLVYSGTAQEPTIVIINRNGGVLRPGIDFTVAYKRDGVAITAADIVGAGNYTAVITANEAYMYTGVFEVPFRVRSSFDINDAELTPIADQLWDGSPSVPEVKLTMGGNPLRPGIDYTAEYKNNDTIGTATVTVKGKGDYYDEQVATFKIVGATLSYTTHVQDRGWTGPTTNGLVSGTTGSSLRVEGMKASLVNNTGVDGGIAYATHIQDIGWQEEKLVFTEGADAVAVEGALSGTEGQSKRLEALTMRLTGGLAETYDIYYRVHAQNAGWMGWASNGDEAGTVGFAYRLEAIQVYLTPKGADNQPPDNFNGAAIAKAEGPRYLNAKTCVGSGLIDVTTHIQNMGDTDFVGANGNTIIGTSGQSLRLEAIGLSLQNFPGSSIYYSTHIQDIGWQDGVSNGALSGTEGQSKRLEALTIRLDDTMKNTHDIYYRTHIQNIGWTGWAMNGEECGSSGYGYRMEAVQIVIVEKGTVAPGLNVNNMFKR